MKSFVLTLLRYRVLVVIALLALLAAGGFAFVNLDIEAYPDPSPPLVEIITQNPSWSAEEMEQQVTVPLETTLNGTPQLDYIRSISIFGLSDVKLYFNFDSDYFHDRQEVLNRLQTVTLPQSLTPQLSPWSPIGEIYRYQIESTRHTLNEVKAAQDWLVRRELKQVPGVIDIVTFGGTTRQYQVELDQQKLLQYNVSVPQVLSAVAASNANTGGNYLTVGSQSVNLRGLGLLRNAADIGNVVIASHAGVPVLLKDVGTIHEGFQQRLGKVGRDQQSDIVEGIVLLNRGAESLPALDALRKKIGLLNNSMLPPGMKIKTIYDRTELINITTETVRHVIFAGLFLVTLLLLLMLGDWRLTLIAALTIPLAVLFAFGLMVLTGRSANLISIGAIDFGILVDASIVVLEGIYRDMTNRIMGESIPELIANATALSARPVLFATAIILVAFIPLFTMRGVPGKIFAPMSITYCFALTGALIFALCFAPVLSSYGAQRISPHETRISQVMRNAYDRCLGFILRRPKVIWGAATLLLIAAIAAFQFVGGEFMPPLEEGNLWVRATLPQDIAFEASTSLADQFRNELRQFPEVTQIVSQNGRPDDGTDVSTFNNIEMFVKLKPADEWPGKISKEELINQMQKKLDKYPGVSFNFSQNIQDNVEEAMSGVKGENSLKLFGDDFNLLTSKAEEIAGVMSKTPGVEDIGVFKVNGQPNLIISIDRTKAARYGIMPADVNAVVQTAIGGTPVTQVIEGDRRFDLTVRFKPEFRQSPEAIRALLLATPDGNRVPLGQVAEVSFQEGAFMIYRENDKRYIPVKFSVRGRDLATTMQDLQTKIKESVKLPAGYTYEWAGEFDSLRKEQRRLALVIPASLAVILVLLFVQFHSWRDALIVMALLPFAATGGIWTLLIAGTPFSISAAVGFTSLIGVATLGAVVFLSGVRRAQREAGPVKGLVAGSLEQMRPVVMACMAAGLGLIPAALSNRIGAQAQQPLARVVVGGMVTTLAAILFLMPLLARKRKEEIEEEATAPGSGTEPIADL
ncbi:MAG TPA: CusA/CzcA family heavy metal efflux RND transporter [Candidatus Angelobacter sp.]|nr:CusA/CzcA family heavy metal efflux RND transporter [Candidatus Angelobacter sp.]